MKWKPEEDGITHVNIYSRGKTELGRKLSNFAHTPFFLDDYGQFASVEGFWYFLQTDAIFRDDLRTQYGYPAKRMGQEFRENFPAKIDEEVFKFLILQAVAVKLKTHGLWEKVRMCEVPFAHYYIFGNLIRQGSKRSEFILNYLEKIRQSPSLSA